MKMTHLTILFLTHLTLFFICVCSQNIAQTQLVYKWSETYCNEVPTVGCNQIPPLKFTLVGFWGTDSNGVIQQGCKDTVSRDWNKVFDTAMVNQLSQFWPSLTKQDPKDMWKESWNTYGTCLTQKFKGPTQYFNRASRLANEIGDLLQCHLINSNGIVPCDSATYNNVEILNSFKQVASNKDVSFTCKKINTTHAYLNQVTFCYTNDAKNFVNCPTSVTNKRCSVQNIIVPRPSPPAPASQALQMKGEELPSNSLWEILGQLF
ncbi:ribonuclease S-2-like [Solanum dulcamara]|uniref:ribonuclease S-2-like n=1 Tax=Solanum dulcamara TaxID=45834 RepID=UPI0024863FE9|nr:ribonuclease S-2-like [Solanum dulcamara]